MVQRTTTIKERESGKWRRNAPSRLDLVDIFEKPGRKGYLHTMAWGDHVRIIDPNVFPLQVLTSRFVKKPDGSILAEEVTAHIGPKRGAKLKPSDVVEPKADSPVLKMNFVDVEQGDAAVLDTWDGRVMLVDGGDNQLFARYLAARNPGTTATSPDISIAS